MQPTSRGVTEYFGKPFDDPDYDALLDDFACDCPARMDEWRELEREMFERRVGLSAYPDKQLMEFCQDYLRHRLNDECGGLAASRAWFVLRGRILRALLDEDPALNPSPGMLLLTEPRTCNDLELSSIVDDFKDRHAETWDHWTRVEAAFDQYGDDPLRDVSGVFHRFVRDRCWVQSSNAIIHLFGCVRSLYFRPARRPA